MPPTAPDNRDEPSFGLGDLIAVLLRRAPIAAPVALLVAGAIAYSLWQREPVYEASANLAIASGSKAIAFDRDPSRRLGLDYLNTERNRLLSTPVLAPVVEDPTVAQAPGYAGAFDPVSTLRNRLKVRTNRDSQVMEVELVDGDPKQAIMILERVLASYLQQLARGAIERHESARTFLSTQVDEARQRLDEARESEQAYRREHDILGEDPEANVHATRLAALERQMLELDGQLIASEQPTQRVEAALALAPQARTAGLLTIDAVVEHPLVLPAQRRLIEARQRRLVLDQTYEPKHPRMIEGERLLEAAEADLDTVLALAAESVIGHRRALLERRERLVEITAAQREDVSRYRESLVGLQALLQEVQSRKRLLDLLLTRLSEEEVAGRMAASNIEVLEPPRSNFTPTNLSKRTIAMIATVIATSVFMAIALTLEALDRRIRASDATVVEGLPILTKLPHIKPVQGPWTSLLGEATVAEPLRSLATAIRMSLPREGSQVLVVTSPSLADGKSTVAIYLAALIAGLGRKVLLVDGDMRRPVVHSRTKLDQARGLSFLLAGDDSVEPKPSGTEHLDILLVGARPPNPSALLHGPRLEAVVERWRESYDVVIIDSPPVLAVSDPLLYAAVGDAALLVVRDRQTTKQAVRNAAATLRDATPNLIGAVLNDSTLVQDGYAATGD